jgi:hypothetical protein
MQRKLAAVVESHHVVADIGAHSHFDVLLNLVARSKLIIDPYNGSGGAGLSAIPELPYPIGLFRCALGETSAIIPDNTFDLTFSISVLEHIGQAESNYDCEPTTMLPAVQEAKRTAFCAELFRITKPGGMTLHTIDHAARNLSYAHNFSQAGFVDSLPGCSVAVDDALHDTDAVRQRVGWLGERVMPPDEQKLHSVLYAAYLKPLRAISTP